MGNKNKIAKASDINTEKISGGYLGRDWVKGNPRAYSYEVFGISHKRNIFSKDKYLFMGKELPKKFIYKMMDKWAYTNSLPDRKYVEQQFSALKNEIKSGNNEMFEKIWEKYG